MSIDIGHCRPRAQKIYFLLREGWQSTQDILIAIGTTEARAYVSELRKILPPGTIEDRWVKHPTKHGVRFKEWRLKPQEADDE